MEDDVMDKHQDRPPDERLRSLAARINAQLPNGMQINIFRREWPDGRSQIGMVYQCGDRRKTVMSKEVKDENIPVIVRDLMTWAEKVQQTSRWTEDPNEADWAIP
jgi:hypothetical protein